MPICNSPPATLNKKPNSDISTDHVSEAAKVKRTREQAYFNSYDFDAIEVLPYDEDAENELAVNKATSAKVHLPVASSISSKSLSTATSIDNSGSSRGSSGRAATGGFKYGYLQRLGAFFGQTRNHTASASTVRNRTGHEQDFNSSHSADAQTVAISNGNFLLPRAMLKYQSVGLVNSMPLADISTLNNGDGKHALNGGNGNGSANMKTIMMNNVNSSNGNGNGNGTTNHTIGDGKTRLVYNTNTNGRDSQTSFLNESGLVAGTPAKPLPTPQNIMVSTLTTTTATATLPSTATPRNKKQSTSSSIITTTASTNESLVSVTVEHDSNLLPSNTAAAAAGVAAVSPAVTMSATASVTSTSAISATSPMKALPENVQLGRASSHQSHYSTDKSGSSGYYSSNVCSTYSLDEHIYCEPVIDILDKHEKSKSIGKVRPQLQLPLTKSTATTTPQKPQTLKQLPTVSQHEDMLGSSRLVPTLGGAAVGDGGAGGNGEAADEMDGDDESDANAMHDLNDSLPMAHYSENLRILETSIENLDRHLKSFPSLCRQDRIVSFMQQQAPVAPMDLSDKLRVYNQLPTIRECHDPSSQRSHCNSWQEEIATDDSLLDIDLDSFLLVSEHKKGTKRPSTGMPKPTKQKACGIENPSFLTDDQVEENNYKCAKYINSCPDMSNNMEPPMLEDQDHYLKRYEDQLHFQSTRELLEDVRDKIRLLTRSRNEMHDDKSNNSEVPKELEDMVQTLKNELESYLQRMNQHSELEIRQLCSGLVKNQNVIKIQKAFERRRSSNSLTGIDIGIDYELNAYEAIRDSGAGGLTAPTNTMIMQNIQSIRCASDPNFKLKRKSITEVFPVADYYIETEHNLGIGYAPHNLKTDVQKTQLQRNLSFQKPILEQLDAKIGTTGGSIRKPSETERSGSAERDSISEWHRKKPSIWEMYYGTNRLHQSLLGKPRSGESPLSSTHPNLSYPSSRPESDFTLDLPRAEQLRLKMEKEKKFRQRCRFITTFLSLVFFLLTVMVVSLVLTRGKRMFGSMI